MTKAELVAALAGFPDDIEVKVTVNVGGTWRILAVTSAGPIKSIRNRRTAAPIFLIRTGVLVTPVTPKGEQA